MKPAVSTDLFPPLIPYLSPFTPPLDTHTFPRHTAGMNPSNPYENRWKWWYPAIADWMVANPGRPLRECAKDLGRGESTIYMIATTDLFKDFLANRRKEWEQRHDFSLREKTTRVAESALDILSEVLEKKRDTIPLARIAEIGFGALDRLGYAPQKQAAVAVNVQQNGNGNGVVVLPVNSDALREAQEAIRVAQAKRAALPSPSLPALENPDDFPVLDLTADEGSTEGNLDAAGEFPRTLPAD